MKTEAMDESSSHQSSVINLGLYLSGRPAESVAAVEEIPAGTAEKAKSPGTIEVEMPGGQILTFRDQAHLREAIHTMRIMKDYKARVNTTAETEPTWSTVLETARADFKSQCLYEPVSAHLQRGALIGSLIGVVLKVVDTTILMFAVNPAAGLVWLVTVASLVTPKYRIQTMLFAIFLNIKLGAGNMFIGALATGLVGLLFGAPAGMVLGAIAGLLRQPGMTRAPDAIPEKSRCYAWKIALPFAWLAFWVPFYFLWLTPKAIQWLSMQ